MTERERKQQEAAEVTEADRMTGATPKGLSTEQAEAALFDEIGKTTPKTPAEKAQDIILKNMETDMKRSAQEVQESTAQTGRASIKELENAGGLAQLAEMVRAINAAGVSVSDPIYETAAAIRKALQGLYDFVHSDAFKIITGAVTEAAAFVQEYKIDFDAIQSAPDHVKDLALFLVKELKESGLLEQYTLQDVIERGFDADGNIIDSPFNEIIERAEKQLAEFEAETKTQETQKAIKATIEAQKAGRELRRQIKENAQSSGAIMNLQNGNLVTFSERDLWDAFAPGRISKIGTLSHELIDKETGRIKKYQLDEGEIMPVNAMDVSYKAFFLLNTILANSVENYREYFIEDGAIKFYVKGVLDDLDIDPRIKNDGQIDINRKTAGVLYLEREFAPLLSFVGTIPDGSRYSVFNYEGYDINTDTMTIRLPYLFQLWKTTQKAYSERKAAKEIRKEEGKKPLKKDQKPLEVNTLFKAVAYKEDDTVLEIATYITNVMLNAGAGAHKTEIKFNTLIKNCPRLHERLKNIERIPKAETQKDGKRVNKTARYNSELRKIARAYSLIMNPDKCDALKYFSFVSFEPTKKKDGKREFMPPTKSTLDGKISIKWHKINTETP